MARMGGDCVERADEVLVIEYRLLKLGTLKFGAGEDVRSVCGTIDAGLDSVGVGCRDSRSASIDSVNFLPGTPVSASDGIYGSLAESGMPTGRKRSREESREVEVVPSPFDVYDSRKRSR